MIDLRYVKKLIDIIDGSTIDSIEISTDKGMKIRISKSPSQRGTVQVAAPMSMPALLSPAPARMTPVDGVVAPAEGAGGGAGGSGNGGTTGNASGAEGQGGRGEGENAGGEVANGRDVLCGG